MPDFASHSMRLARLYGPRRVLAETAPAPGPPGAGRVRLAVGAVGICGSDLHVYEHGRIGSTRLEGPLIQGHEFAGTVGAVGEGAVDGEGGALAAGDRVAVDPAWPCGACEPCREGNPNLCEHHAFAGLWPTDGALAEAMLVPAAACFKLPAALDLEAGAMLEPLGVALHAADLGHVRVGQTAAVVGAGPIGLLIARVLRAAGAGPVFVAEPRPDRRRRAAGEGLEAVHGEAAGAGEAIRARTGGRGVDVAFEAAWSTPASLAEAAAAVRPGGRLVVVGIAGDDTLRFPHGLVRRRGLTIMMCRRMKHTYPRAIRLVERGAVAVGDLVTHRFPLEGTPEAFERVFAGEPGLLKAVVRVSGS